MSNNKTGGNKIIFKRLDEYLKTNYRLRERHPFPEKISYWVQIFEKILPDEPQQFFHSKLPDRMDLWLFSNKYILKINDFLNDEAFEKDNITIYPLSQLVGNIDIDTEDYSLHSPDYNDTSKITVRIRINQVSNPIEIKAANKECSQLVDAAKFILGNL